MSLGTEFSALAVEQITSGDLWTHSATFTYGPRRTKTNKWDEATDGASISQQTLQVAAVPVMRALEEGGRKVSMWEIYVPAATITTRPNEEDKVSLDGTVHPIIACVPYGANGVNALYQVLALR